MKKCLLALLCVLLVLAFTACEQEAATSSQPSSAPETSSTESVQPTPTPTAEPTPTPTPTPTPEPTPTPDASSAGEHHQLPPIDTDDPEFAAAFEANGIDAGFLEDSQTAVTTLAMNQLYEKYIGKWEEQVDAIYKELLAKTKDGEYGEDAYDTIKTGQEEWVNATPAALDTIRESAGGTGGSAASLDIASKIMQYYRDRAAELSSIYYQMTGETGIE